MKNSIFLSFALAATSLTGCITQKTVTIHEAAPATRAVAAQQPMQLILDADFGSSTDDLFAIMMLHHYIDEGLVDLKGVIVDREGEKNAQLVDVFNTYFGHPDIPIGMERNGVKNPRCFIPYNGIVDLKDDQGRPLFARSYANSEFPDGYKLYRKLLSQAEDKSISIVAIGFVTTLSQLFQSPADEYSPLTGLELFERKVKAVYIQSGRFESGDNLSGYNMRAASRQSAIFYDRFPKSVEIIMSPSNIGDAIDYSPKDVLVDLSATEKNPIKAVYTYYTCDTGQRMWDTNCLVNAVKGDNEYNMSPRGWVKFVDQGNESLMLFTPDPMGNARYQLPGDSFFANDKLLEIRRNTRMVPNPAPYTIEAPQPQIVGEDALDWAKLRVNQLVDKYLGSAGNNLDPNEVRMLFRPLGFTGPNLADFEAATDYMVDAIYDRMLQKAVRAGRRDMIIVTGPPASGKTKAASTFSSSKVGLVFDADLSDGDKLSQVIAKAKAAGMDKITLIPVYNDPMSCYHNSIENGRRTWRFHTLEQVVTSFRNNIGKLDKVIAQYPDLEILPVDSSNGQGVNRVDLDAARKWDYSISETQLSSLFTYLLELLNTNGIEPNSVPAATGNVLSIQTSDPTNQSLAQQIEARKQAIMQEYKMR